MTDAGRRIGPESAMLRLRGRRGALACQVFWPAPGGARRLVVAFGTAPGARDLCRSTGRIVLAETSASAVSSDDAWDVLCWAGEHAAELGARVDAVLLDCRGVPVELVDSLRARADEEGWPRLSTLSHGEAAARPDPDRAEGPA